MKIYQVALVAAGLASAHPHQHAHSHKNIKRESAPALDVVTVPGPTVVMYTLNGSPLPEGEVLEGIKNGTLVWANGAPQIANPAKPAPQQVQVRPAPDAPANSAPASPTDATPDSSTSAAATSSAPAGDDAPGDADAPGWAVGSGIDADFPDGELDCSTFPSDYGPLNLDWFNLGGWIGVQDPGTAGSDGYDDIETVLASSCSGSDCCSEGRFCSYACPAGYQKSQWPSTQGSDAQSVGGLQCVDGKLRLTNSALSSKLCMQGTSAVKVEVQNNLGQPVSVCRTDYPGTESETVPLSVSAGGSQPLTCPDQDNYYKWLGQPTSAQYYVNPAGVGVEDACKWGNGGNTGNWAPLNLGVGYSDGLAFISMLPNKPTTDEVLDFKVTLSGGDLGQSCTYQKGVFTANIIPGGSSDNGCTISASSGTLTYVFESL